MKSLRRYFLLCFLIFVLGWGDSSHHQVWASEEFETSYEAYYQVFPQGVTKVTQKISFTNKFSDVYVSGYTLTLEAIQIKNIQARDEQGPLLIDLKKDAQKTIISLKFNQQVVGKGKTLNFELSYETPDLANKKGQTWEISIPKIANPEQIDHYRLILMTPLEFGPPASINPTPLKKEQKKGLNFFYFDKSQLVQTGIRVVFGQFQIFDFSLSYYLSNPHSTFFKTKIALPPDTAYQTVSYYQITPPPLNVIEDEDGNWLAEYLLPPKEKLKIKAQGKVRIYSQPKNDFPLPSKAVLKKNLEPQPYWPVNSPLIQKRAKNFKNIKEIYKFVVNFLDYDFNRVKKGTARLGADVALLNPQQAICTEFTDLFITLARAAGIPAREINGYAYTTNPDLQPLSLLTDILHAWPEYWDEKRKVWVPVDPTWEKTTGGIDYFSKFDLNHFVFAIHGSNSQFPLPVGSYREKEKDKTIEIKFGQYQNEETPHLKAKLELPPFIFSGIKTKGKITLINQGPGALYHLPLEFEKKGFQLQLLTKEKIEVLPPFSSREIPFEMIASNWWKTQSAKMILKADGQTFAFSFLFKSPIWHFFLPLLILVVSIVGLIFLTTKLVYAKKKL